MDALNSANGRTTACYTFPGMQLAVASTIHYCHIGKRLSKSIAPLQSNLIKRRQIDGLDKRDVAIT